MRKYCFHFSLLFSYEKFLNQSCNCTVEPIFLFTSEWRGLKEMLPTCGPVRFCLGFFSYGLV